MYQQPPMSSTPTPSPDGSSALISQSERADRRSSSPFEVKLTPMVAKRMSLDAFGSLTPPYSEEDHPTVEQLTDEHEVEPPHPLANFLGTSLSTIRESPSSRGHQSSCAEFTSSMPVNTNATSVLLMSEGESQPRWRPKTPRTDQTQSRYYTPTSSPARKAADGLPLPIESPFVPPRHQSAPPLAGTMALIDAQSDHSRNLQAEVQQYRAVIEAMQADLRRAHDTLEEEGWDKGKLAEAVREQAELVIKLQVTLTETEQLRATFEARSHSQEEGTPQRLAVDQGTDMA